MNTGTRLGLYGGGLALVFAAAFGAATLTVPDGAADEWSEQTESEGHGGGEPVAVRGLSIEQDGYELGEVAAPSAVGEAGTLAFQITGTGGGPLTEYTVSHERELHLIVVRADGTHFRHVHPELAADGTWSLPWTWDAPGTYRVYADFVPADDGEGTDVTLTRTVEVAGEYAAETPAGTVLTAEVDGLTVTLEGDLQAGSTAELTTEVTQGGEPVTDIEPYLGAFGHLVALREGDLAYLHVHPEGDEPAPGELSGPQVTFATDVPTEGRYFLYFDFQVDGQVHTAAFVVEAAAGEPGDEHQTESDGH